MIIPPPIESTVRVRSPRSVVSWRARVVAIPQPESYRWGRVERVAVIPLERGRGWTSQAVVVPLEYVEREE